MTGIRTFELFRNKKESIVTSNITRVKFDNNPPTPCGLVVRVSD